MSNKKETTAINHCKICAHPTVELYDPQLEVTYDVCHHCDFISKHESYILSPQKEKARYDTHNNTPDNTGYVTFFETLLNLHVRPLKNVKSILDFGSGPYPILKYVFEQHGYQVTNYDPFYENDTSFKDHCYDLIVIHEVIEHLSNPIKELDMLVPLLKADGYLLIRTEFRPILESEFLSWWYKRDETHISFFNETTIFYLCQKYNLKIIDSNHKNTVVLQK